MPWGIMDRRNCGIILMHVQAHILQQAMELYLQAAYPGGVPAAVEGRVQAVRQLAGDSLVPVAMLEQGSSETGGASTAGIGAGSYALRLGQPLYPHMKLVLDPVPAGQDCGGCNFLLRVDSHDRHLHAAPGSPDAAWLASVRQSNKELGERIEAAWAATGLPTFKEYLRRQLDERRKAAAK
jgi:hypothetical protein